MSDLKDTMPRIRTVVTEFEQAPLEFIRKHQITHSEYRAATDHHRLDQERIGEPSRGRELRSQSGRRFPSTNL